MAKLKKGLLPLAAALSTALFTQNASAVMGTELEFHGYMRSGIGTNSKGGDQVCFQVPGALWKYRLGNECENYFETTFGAGLFTGPAGEYFNLRFTLAYVVDGATDFEQFAPALRELWIDSGNIFGGFLEGANIWAGKRFYRRHDVHINDFFFWDVSGPGGGIENVDLGFGRAALAVLRGIEVEPREVIRTIEGELITLDEASVEDRATSRIDVRLYDIETNPGGMLTLGADFRLADESRDVIVEEINGVEVEREFKSKDGYGATIIHFQDNPFGLGGFNKLALQFGMGSAMRVGQAFSNDEASGRAKSFRVVEQILIEPNPDWSLFVSGVFEFNNSNDGIGGDGIDSVTPGIDRKWISAGIRPIYYLSDFVNVAFEYGFDYIDIDNQNSRYLHKVTLAPQLSAGRGFWVRPLLRGFVTYANWNPAARETGLAGGEDGVFGSDTYGFTFGLQAEAWW